MDEIVILDSEDSQHSIIEVAVPGKPPPPVFDVEDEETIINVSQRNQTPVLAATLLEVKEVKGISKASSKCQSSSRKEDSITLSPSHWTLDMIKFYNDDWGDEEEFEIGKIQAKMDKSPSLWKISKKDILAVHTKFEKNRMKCWNCCQRGHHFSLCPDPPNVPKCHMCGTPGHLEYSCPNAICLNCGNQQKEFVTDCYKCRHQTTQECSRCQMIGHNFIDCTDHWRLFHLTTNSNHVIIPEKDIYKPKKDRWCSNCGKQGHFRSHCTSRKDFGGFRDTLPFVSSYHKAFSDELYRSNDQSWKRKKKNDKECNVKVNPLNRIIKKSKNYMNKKFRRFRKKNKGKWKMKNEFNIDL